MEQLRLGKLRYWLKNNWFPASVAAATILLGIAAIMTQVLAIVLD